MNNLQPHKKILDIAPYVPGESKIPGIEKPIKLSSNEGALGPSPKAINAYKSLSEQLHRYPDGGADELRNSLGNGYNLPANQIVCGAGSDEILGLLAKAYAGPGDEILFGEHAFVMYPIFALAAGATPVKAKETKFTISIDSILDNVTPKTRIVYIANPNNPTGTMVTEEEMQRLRAELRQDILLVIDAAYAEYVTRSDYSSGKTLVDQSNNVVMTRTFSKIYALGALRLGWAYCPQSITDVLHRIRPPFNVNSAAQSAGIASIEDVDFMIKSRNHNEKWRIWLSRQLEEAGLKVVSGVANFVLVIFSRTKGQSAGDAMNFLAAKGIIIRSTASAGIPDGIRITIGTEEEMRITAATLREFVETK